MGWCNLRSLLVAAIVLNSCITWTASKHHYTHNVLRHRSRHRRQGAGLFLASSYVIPGGEGYGAWGPWGEVSPCSRTCGGGVASQKRICLEVGADGQPTCSGGDTKYFSCQTQDCPPGSQDFRAQQCSEYDDVAFRGVKYQWIPYTKSPNQCELNCRPRGERFYYRQALKVVDGTRCNEDSFDVCVDGTCQPVGCDLMLGSNAREDKCRECRGNGTNCHTASGTFDSQNLTQGYNDLLLIPQGATSISISEVRASNNYLALRSKHYNRYYLNGDYHIDFPRSIVIAGALWQYERSQQGFPAPDKLKCLGPTNEPLYLSLLLQDVNVGVDYEYSIPRSMAPAPDQQYSWVFDQYSPCSASCGGGIQFRNVSCRSRDDLELVDDTLCDDGLKPPSNQTCATQPCAPRWVEGPWSPCSKPCGQGGTRSRSVHCEKIITNGYPSIVDDAECISQLGPIQADLYQECNKNVSCPTWFTGPWKPCDKLCGPGKQTRQVVCHQKIDGKVEVFADDACVDEKPESEQACYLHPCEGVDWVLSEWSGCDNCLSKKRTRQAECATKERVVVNSTFCSNHPTPILEEDCDRTKLPPCTVQWYATQWSDCSVECGKGIKTRRLFCGLFDGTSVIKVDDNRCQNESRYNDTKPCEIPEEKCPSKWFAAPWSACTKTCGGGLKYRRVMCLRGSLLVNDCDENGVPDHNEACNTGPCDIDETLPVDSSSTPIMDDDYDDEECIDDEYPEEGVEEDEDSASTIDDLMFSDSPYTEITEEGSGIGSTSMTELETDLTSESGSGFSTDYVTTESTEISETSESVSTGETSSIEPSLSTESTDTTYESSTKTSEESSVTTESDDTVSVTIETSATSDNTEITDSSSVINTDLSSESSFATTESVGETSGSTETSSSETSSESSLSTTETSGSTDSSSVDTSEYSTTDSSTTELSSESSATDETSTVSVSPESDLTSDNTDTTFLSSTEMSTESSSESSLSTTETIDETTGTTEAFSSETTENLTVDYSTTETSSESSSTDSSTLDDSSTSSTDLSTEASTFESSTTEFELTGTTDGSSETSSTDTTEPTETGSTETGSTETSITESGTTETGETGSSETSESTIFDGPSTTEFSSEETTPWDWASTVELFTKRPRCKARKKAAKCAKSTFGCCPDNRTAAAGPFDEGCDHPTTCKESKYKCCPDGVSPAKGPNGKGCPLPPCNETLYGCCLSDKKTAAEGNNQEGCPPPPPKCKSTKFGCCKDEKTEAEGPNKKGCPETESTKKSQGCEESRHGCCYDNKTEASGPNGKGCPCNATEYGCCPDNFAPAHGPQMEGCVMSCNTSAFGCCPDGETPAHGPSQEGCCLLTPFGCCPDNYKPAEGPRREGCGCQYSQFGCCPDNATIARGYNNVGCGCQYTQHGCCPDRHTEALGPNYEGCACHTYQFGCCPDGTTVAKGPNLQGCHCSQSEFGCCGDGQTAAKGPNFAGCDCAASKYGCCPDGQTEAQGAKFLGCTDVPINRQAGCSLKTDRGPCRDYTVSWYYDMEYGGCSRFWYGGCEGNGNRFSSQEECQDVCVHPSPKDACKLPKVKGACQGYHLHWYFDSEREQCGQFVYGGCLGNDNNFETREACQAHCEPTRSDDQCKLPIERGSCAGNFSRWGFSVETGRCEQFIWGGCEGNANRFGSEAACVQRCDPPGALKPECTLQQEVGNCTEKLARWSFSQTEDRCVPFYYTGCHGNENNFQTLEDCSSKCPSSYIHDTCVLPAETGECADYRVRWYYDTAEQRCRQFYFGGCGGNGNNFGSESECENNCRNQAVTTTTTAPLTPEPFRQEFCFMEKDRGACSERQTRWAYDADLGSCTTFEYGGCGGNRNNFPSQEYCQYFCAPVQDVCQLPMSAGPCGGSEMRWFYDAATDSCSQFTYGGCEGNDNRFESREQCERRCRTGPVATTPSITTTTEAAEEVPPECQVSAAGEACDEGGRVWYLDPERRECVPHDNRPPGPCRLTNVFTSQEGCERSCGAFRSLEVCRYSVDAGPCQEVVPKFFYNGTSGQCESFTYGGCHGGPNRFSSSEECEQTCMQTASTDPCRQPSEPGVCRGYFVKWYFDAERGQCAQFVYGGCRGNDNRFDTQAECESRCIASPSGIASPPQINTRFLGKEEECSTPTSLAPCGANITVFYYDAEREECLAADIGGCSHPNSHRSEEECERRCGSFQGLDVCRYTRDPGPCRVAQPKFYYDAVTGACQSFSYGGCGGGPNRFSTIEECEEICASLAPEPSGNEVLPDCDRFNDECSRIRCEFGVQRTRTASGCERCSCVPVDTNCEALAEECSQLKCVYGVEKTSGADGCERCSCREHPCAALECPAGQRCVATPERDDDGGVRYQPACRTVEKSGWCPATAPAEGECRRECNDDADCAGADKCCAAGCRQLCLPPGAPTTPAPRAPELPQAPQASPETEPEVTAEESGKATLRCLFHGNPPPKITWQRGQVTIDGSVGRYRLLSDGALEIVSLYRNDSGVYICVADNGLGTARQEIRLQVTDPVERPAGISGDEGAVVTGELGRGLALRCLAYGYPPPTVAWSRGVAGPMVPYSSHQYEARGQVLRIRALEPDTLGEYACHAYNGLGKPASWSVVVRAYRADGERVDSPYVVPRAPSEVAVTPRTPAPTPTPPAPVPTTPPVPARPQVPRYAVRVSARLRAPEGAVPAGSDVSLPCDVDGYPTPSVTWTRGGQQLLPSDRLQLSDARLTILRATPEDSGEYGCHAANRFSSDSSTATILIEGRVTPSWCSDNPFFANCALIIRSKYCHHRYYSGFCCKSCVEAGQITLEEIQAMRVGN